MTYKYFVPFNLPEDLTLLYTIQYQEAVEERIVSPGVKRISGEPLVDRAGLGAARNVDSTGRE